MSHPSPLTARLAGACRAIVSMRPLRPRNRPARPVGFVYPLVFAIIVLLVLCSVSVTRAAGEHPRVLGSGMTAHRLDRSISSAVPGNRDVPPEPPKSPIVATINVGSGPQGIVYDPANAEIYVANQWSHNLTVIKGTSIVASVPLPVGPTELTYDSVNEDVYVANQDSQTERANVTAVNGTSVVGSIPVGVYTSGIGFDPVFNLVYVDNWWSQDTSLVRGFSVVGSIPTPWPPFAVEGVVVDPARGFAYGFIPYAGSVVFNGSTVSTNLPENFPIGENGTYDPSNGDVYLTDDYYSGCAGRIGLVIGNEVVGYTNFDPWNVCGGFAGAAADPSNGFVFTASPSVDSVYVINGTSEIGEAAVGSYPVGVAFNPSNGDVYVTNERSNNVTVLNGSFYDGYPGVTEFAAVPTSVEIGSANQSTATLTVNATGNVGAFSYTYTGLPSGCKSVNASVLRCSPIESGDFTIGVYVNLTNVASHYTAVSLDVVGPLAASLSVSPNPTDAGFPVSFVTTASDHLGNVTYSWRFGDGGSSTGEYASHRYLETGNYSAKLWVNDSVGGAVEHDLPITVVKAMTVSARYTNASIILGQSTTINTTAFGGQGPYAFGYDGLPPGCYDADVSELSCVPTQAGYFNTTVFAADAIGAGITTKATLQVILDFSLVAPVWVTLGQPLFVWVKAGATAQPLTYNWTGLPPGCMADDNSASVRCTPSQPGFYNISVTVHDRFGHQATHAEMVLVAPAVVPSTSSGTSVWPIGAAIVVVGAVALAVVVFSRWRRRR